ncbi:MAG: SBBP repeat-containing protein [Chloroflexota bacterium]|nr:MAG: SBBP repeat-containing protein [Chloroflexota bacterium]
MLRKTILSSVVLLILILMVVYPLSDLMPRNRSIATAALATKENIQEAYGKLPLLFIQNQGQLDESVEYYVKSPSQTLYFTKESIVFDLTPNNQAAASATADSQADRLVFSLDFLGASSNPSIEGTDKDGAVVNYFIGNDPEKWHTDIPTYKEVVYHDIYPSVDLRLFGKGNVLEYDFVVRPGASPDDIALAYNGIDSLRIENGELVAATAFGDIEQYMPYIYQQIGGEKVQVDGGFRLGGSDTYGFYVADYDNCYPLVIDPTLAYSTFLGGSGFDHGQGIAVDSSGGAYVAGRTTSGNFPTRNPYQVTKGGDYDVFVAKLSAVGNSLIYSTYLGGSQNDYCRGIAVDSAGDAYVVGFTTSTDFPTRDPYQGTYAGRDDAFVARLSADGNALVYSTYLGGSEYDRVEGIAVDSTSSAYITGWTFSTNFPTQNPYQGIKGGDYDAFVTKLSAAGNSLIYSTYLGGSGFDQGNGIAVDASGGAYVTGLTSSLNFPTRDPYQGKNDLSLDVFVARLSAAGNSLVYSTYLGGNDGDQGNGIAVDSTGSAYVIGETYSNNFPIENPYQGTRAGLSDAFVTKLSPAGNSLIYSTYLGGSGFDDGCGIAIDASSCAYVTGLTSSLNFPTRNPYQETNAGSYDVFVSKIALAPPTVITVAAVAVLVLVTAVVLVMSFRRSNTM